MPIRPDMTVHQVLSKYPYLIALFKQHGLSKFESPKTLAALGPFLKLQTASTAAGLNPQQFIDLLQARIDEQSEADAQDAGIRHRDLTVLALLPCGMKMPFNRAFDDYIETHNQSHSSKIHYMVEGNVNHEVSYYEYIDRVTSIEELPDIIISADINSFYHNRFKDAFLKKGLFTNMAPLEINPDIADIAFGDPDGDFTMLSANLLVVAAVNELMGDRPLPESWGDLLDPAFENSVVMRGDAHFFCNGVLLPIYQMHGMKGIEQFGRSVAAGVHPSSMVKTIDSRKSDVPALYIMPYFFAQKIKRQDRITLIVPKEGAIISPVQMLVKKDADEDALKIAQFLAGPEMGQICADAHFPSVHPKVQNSTRKMPLYWLGWEFINHTDLGALKEKIAAVFRSNFNTSGGRL